MAGGCCSGTWDGAPASPDGICNGRPVVISNSPSTSLHLAQRPRRQTRSSLCLSHLIFLSALSIVASTMASGAEQPASSQYWYRPLSESQDNLGEARAALFNMLSLSRELVDPRDIIDSPQPAQPTTAPSRDALLVLLPLLIILSSLLFFLLLFLVCVLFIRRRRGVVLRDNDGPIDMSREELIDGEGGFEGVEERWLESVDEETRRNYGRAKG